ncbi:hypothetical protein [Enterobacter sp. 22466]|uniref:hypothetical protein n=1 Tax=Enterobacter sp. 22466 TaxID=3453924 RepID=UPI003F86C635
MKIPAGIIRHQAVLLSKLPMMGEKLSHQVVTKQPLKARLTVQDVQQQRLAQTNSVFLPFLTSHSAPVSLQGQGVVSMRVALDSLSHMKASVFNRTDNALEQAAQQCGQRFPESHTGEGGPDQGKVFICNVMGSQVAFEALQAVRDAEQKQENNAATQAGQFGEMMVSAAQQAGNKIVSAADNNLTGAITGATLGVGAAVGSSLMIGKAMKRENTSIEENLVPATEAHQMVGEQRNNWLTSRNDLVGRDTPEDLEMAMQADLPGMNAAAEIGRHNHSVTANKNIDYRTRAQTLETLGRSTDTMIQSGFATAAASDNSQSKMLETSKDLDNTLTGSAQKSHETASKGKDEALETMKQIVRQNQDTISSMASAAA